MTDLTKPRKAYHDWIAAEGPHQAHVPDAVDAYVAALEAEIERLASELTEAKAREQLVFARIDRAVQVHDRGCYSQDVIDELWPLEEPEVAAP